jgi:hypothetical protein
MIAFLAVCKLIKFRHKIAFSFLNSAALVEKILLILHKNKLMSNKLCREGYFILPYNELAIAQGPKIQQKNGL